MALNKAQTSVGVKIVLGFIIVAFVVSLIPWNGCSSTTTGTPTGTGTDAVSQVNAQYQPTVAALTAQLQSDPTSYTVLVNLGNSYFDWAIGVQGASQGSTSTVGADAPLWIAAKDAYRRAVEVKADEASVLTDYAIVTFYSGDTVNAIKIAEGVTKTNPDFAPAWFNLGVFYSALGQNGKAIAAYEKSLEIDPDGTQSGGNPDYAKSEIERLKSAPATATP